MEKKIKIILVLAAVTLGVGVLNYVLLLKQGGYMGGRKQVSAGAQICRYRGDVNITEGAHEGLTLQGDLYVARNVDSSKIIGDFNIKGNPLGDGTKTIPMTGTVKSGKINMKFTLPGNGGTVNGTGAFSTAAEECRGEVEGLLAGPARDDKGDWLFDLSSSTTVEDISCSLEFHNECYGAGGDFIIGPNGCTCRGANF